MITFQTDSPSWSLSVEVDDNSYRQREIMGGDLLELHFSLPQYTAFPVGCYCIYDNITYKMHNTPQVTKKNDTQYDYVLTMHAPYYRLKEVMFRNPIDGRLSFTLTAKAHEHLQMLVDILNAPYAPDTPWTIGGCVSNNEDSSSAQQRITSGGEVMVSYDYNNCYEALDAMAEAFNTEFYIDNRVIYLINVEYAKNNPLHMAYGQDKGFLGGIKRIYDENEPVVGKVFVQGSERNIPPTGYNSKTLLLPANGEIYYDGETFYNAVDSYGRVDATHYVVTDNRRAVVKDGDQNNTELIEGSYDGTAIYPQYIGTVGKVEVEDDEKNWINIIDYNAAFTNTLEEMTIAGMKPTIVFQSGNLAGREFDVSGGSKGVSEFRCRLYLAAAQSTVHPERYTVFNGSYTGEHYSDEKLIMKKDTDSDLRFVVRKLRTETLNGVTTQIYKMMLYDQSTVYESMEFTWAAFMNVGGMSVRPVQRATDTWEATVGVSQQTESTSPDSGWRLDIVPCQLDEVWMPGGNPEDNYDEATGQYKIDLATNPWVPHIGDKYILFNIKLPDAYFRRDSDLSGAEWDLMKDVVKYLHTHSKEVQTFAGPVDRIWAKRHWDTAYIQDDNSTILGGVGQYMRPGMHILYKDEYMIPDGALLRVTGTKSSINHAEDVTLTISNALVRQSLGRTVVRNIRNAVSHAWMNRHLATIQEAASRQTEETITMIEGVNR